MRNKIFLTSLLVNFLTSCATQPPAPIEYNADTKQKYDQSTREALPYEEEVVHQNLDPEVYLDPDEKASELDRGIAELNLAPNISAEYNNNYSDTSTNNKVTHEVIEGENVKQIAERYNISKDDLIKSNNLSYPYELHELQILQIPSSDNTNLNKDNKSDKIKEIEAIARNNNRDKNKKSQVFSPSSKLMMPVSGTLLAKFGEQLSTGKNRGININAKNGDDVKSITSGTVIYAKKHTQFGNMVIIKSDNPSDLCIVYGHLSDLIVSENNIIQLGQVIGHVGSTGQANGKAQLHLEIRKGSVALDPMQYLQYP